MAVALTKDNFQSKHRKRRNSWWISGRHGADLAKCSFRSLRSFPTELEGKATIAKINVDEEPELASQFGVMSIPDTDSCSKTANRLTKWSVCNRKTR